jgi:predicted MFS family arabinose efflux permease
LNRFKVFNFLLTLTPQDRRTRYTALYQIVVTAALALGAALGGGLGTWQGYRFTFAFSALGRLVAALLFVRVIRRAAARPRREPVPAGAWPDCATTGGRGKRGANVLHLRGIAVKYK